MHGLGLQHAADRFARRRVLAADAPARRAVAKLAELKKGSVAALLAPLRAEYLAPLLAKRLRSLPLLTQVAYVEAISFCIKQTSADGSAPLLPLDAAMVGVLREVLATAMDKNTDQNLLRLKYLPLHQPNYILLPFFVHQLYLLKKEPLLYLFQGL